MIKKLKYIEYKQIFGIANFFWKKRFLIKPLLYVKFASINELIFDSGKICRLVMLGCYDFLIPTWRGLELMEICVNV